MATEFEENKKNKDIITIKVKLPLCGFCRGCGFEKKTKENKLKMCFVCNGTGFSLFYRKKDE